jgi:hypothetical protein
MKLEDITVGGIQAWIQSKTDVPNPPDDDFMSDISIPLARTKEVDGLNSVAMSIASISAQLGCNPLSSILAFGICLGLEIAADGDKHD